MTAVKTTENKTPRRSAPAKQAALKAHAVFVGRDDRKDPLDENHIPQDWNARAIKAYSAYVENYLVRNCVDAWLVISLGEDWSASSENEDAASGLNEMMETLKVRDWVKSNIIQLLTKGDCVAGRIIRNNELKRLTTFNPVSCSPEYSEGVLISMTQTAADGKTKQELPVDQIIHRRWNAAEFEPRGLSMVIPAFPHIALIDDYLRAERATAKRWVNPFRMLKVGGYYGNKLFMPTETDLEAWAGQINKMDGRKILVTPFTVAMETDGAKDKILETVERIKKAEDNVLIALRMPRVLVTGDGPNFATSQVVWKKIRLMCNEIIDHAAALLRFACDPWLELNGYAGVKYSFNWPNIDPDSDADQKRVMLEFYDRGLIKPETMQLLTGLPQSEVKAPVKPATAREVALLVGNKIITTDEARAMMGLEGSAPTTPAPTPAPATQTPPPAAATDEHEEDEHVHADADPDSFEKAAPELEAEIKAELDIMTTALGKASSDVEKALAELEAAGVDGLNETQKKKRLASLKKQFDAAEKSLAAALSEGLADRENSAILNGSRGALANLFDLGVGGIPSPADEEAFGRLALGAFDVIDAKAVEAAVKARLDLALSVANDLATGIQTEITSGILAGKSVQEVASQIGSLVIDKEGFVQAGGRVYQSVYQRAITISRTETMRAHNSGRIAEYDNMGVKKVRLLVSATACPEKCQPLSGREYLISEAPALPLHPNCTCTWTAVIETAKSEEV